MTIWSVIKPIISLSEISTWQHEVLFSANLRSTFLVIDMTNPIIIMSITRSYITYLYNISLWNLGPYFNEQLSHLFVSKQKAKNILRVPRKALGPTHNARGALGPSGPLPNSIRAPAVVPRAPINIGGAPRGGQLHAHLPPNAVCIHFQR